MKKPSIVLLLALILTSSCASKKIKEIGYLKTESPNNAENPENAADSLRLNVFQPRKSKSSKSLKPVIIFVHGGNWNSGNKNTYGFLGRNFAKNDLVTVIPSYTLSPNANFDTMATQIAEALQWVANNIETYGGNPEAIYLMGHSAGGHLIALISTHPKYVAEKSIIKGVILNDAAGLDMYSYLQKYPPTTENNYMTTWTKDQSKWKQASPVYFLSEASPDFMIYVGLKTYPSITRQNKTFLEELNKFQPEVEPIYLNKKHVPMMTQYFWPWSGRYDEIMGFIKKE